MEPTTLLILTLTIAVSAKQQSGTAESSANAAHKAADAMKSLTVSNPAPHPGHQDNTKPDAAEDEYAGAPAMIRGKMQKRVARRFRNASTLREAAERGRRKTEARKAEDILVSHYQIIHSKCRKEWPDDFEMRAYCENKQFDALRNLRDR